MSLKTILVTVNEDGTVKTDYSNFAGAECLAVGKQLHAQLAQFGVQMAHTDIIPKPELLAVLGEQQELATQFGTNQDLETEG